MEQMKSNTLDEILIRLQRIEEKVDKSTTVAEPVDKPMTTTEVAQYLGVKYQTIYKYINRGALPYYKIGAKKYFKRADVDAFLKVK